MEGGIVGDDGRGGLEDGDETVDLNGGERVCDLHGGHVQVGLGHEPEIWWGFSTLRVPLCLRH